MLIRIYHLNSLEQNCNFLLSLIVLDQYLIIKKKKKRKEERIEIIYNILYIKRKSTIHGRDSQV